MILKDYYKLGILKLGNVVYEYFYDEGKSLGMFCVRVV